LQTTSSSSLHASSSSSSRKKHHHSNGERKRSKRKEDDENLVKEEDLTVLADLGAGNGGTVTKVWNKKRNCVMAKKVGEDCGVARVVRGGVMGSVWARQANNRY
jgi:mitogen-activated protein kinase kinase